ncbi:MAG: phage portal protein [Bacteroidales bacterium]|nr:phage portal protein [Bacteroidales bacterium]
MSKRPGRVRAEIIKGSQEIKKAETSVQITPEDSLNTGDWICQPTDLRGLKMLVDQSTIIPQCIQAYKRNIAGFGIGVRYIDDREETPEMAEEYTRMEEIVELLNTERDTKEIFEDIIAARETYGVAYLEVIRNLAGEVEQIEYIEDVPSVTKTKPLDPYLDYEFWHHGETVTRKKRYRKYRQEIGGRVVYYKEFGDPRIMDLRSGEYVDGLDIQYRANEILEFALGTAPYGEVRWIGQVLGIDGAHRAEILNNNYFINGRHTPLMIMVQNGTLTDESFAKLERYMDDIKGESGQHAFIVLESESTDARVDFDTVERPSIEIKDLAGILQKDELFQDYQENSRRRVQSAFQLPDLYVAYTTDFNRATAQTAMEVTEKQVFQPERRSLAWIINNRLLNAYQFRYVEAYFMESDISNPDDIYKLLTVANQAGGLSPNMAKEIICEAMGRPMEDYPNSLDDASWADLPISFQRTTSGGFNISDIETLTSGSENADSSKGTRTVDEQLEEQIEKAERDTDIAVVAVMKEVRDLLMKMEGGGGDVPVLPTAD